MPLLDQIERRFRRYALPHVTTGLILCQVVAYCVAQGEIFKAPAGDVQPHTVLDHIALVPDKVLAGEVWRFVTFVCEPPTMNFLFAFFFWYLFNRLRQGRRSMEFQASLFGGRSRAYFHRCTVCGITDQSDPHAQFRYCRKCDGSHAYCMEHLLNHEHIEKES